MSREYDLIVFGATGYAGFYVAQTVAYHAQNRKWAIAGRDTKKLELVLQKVCKTTKNEDIKNVPCIRADVSDEQSIMTMASKTKVLLNCVGPYRFYGEPVVKACVENGTDYVDISGEPIFLEKMVLLYDDLARRSSCFVVSACGFDSIPSDVGTQYTAKNFQGTLNSVEIYHQIFAPDGVTINVGTLQSAIYGIANQHELTDVRSSLKEKRKNPFPKLLPKINQRGMLFYNDDLKCWCIPFLGSDRSVIQRSILYDYEHNDKRPIQTQVYCGFSSLFTCLLFIVFGAIFMLLCKFKLGRYLFKTYPEYMTFGLFSKAGPSEKQLETTTFKTTIFGTGWANKFLGPNDSADELPSDKITCTVEGAELGYVATSAMLVASALTLLEDKEKIRIKGGVLTSANAFENTKVIERLEAMGVRFSKI